MAIADPRDIPGLLAWYSAEAETGYSNGQAMTTWTDISGHGNHATAIGAPQWSATAGPTGGPAVSNTSGGFTLPAGIMTGATEGEAAFYLLPVSGTTNGGQWDFGSSSGISQYPFSGTIYDDFGSTARKTLGTLPNRNWQRYEAMSRAGEWTAWIDGTQFYTTATNTVGWLNAPIIGRSSGTYYLGAYTTLVLFNRKLTTTERADLNSWMVAHPSGGTTAAAPSVTGTLAVTAPAARVNLADWTVGNLTATAPAATVGVIGEAATAGAAVIAAPKATVSISGTVASVAAGTLAPTAPAARVNLAGNAADVVQTDTRNEGDGRIRDGYAAVSTTTGVTLPANLATRVDKAVAYPTPTLVNGRPT